MKCWSHGFWLFCLICLLNANQASGQNVRFDLLESQVKDRASQLSDLLKDANAKRLDIRKEKIALKISDVFLRFAKWDLTHQAELQAVLSKTPTNLLARREVSKVVSQLPGNQLTELKSVLDSAIQSLNKKLQNPGAHPRPKHWPVDFANAKVSRGYYRVNGRPVLPYSFFWIDDSLPLEFGQFKNIYAHPADLQLFGSGPGVTLTRRQRFRESLMRNSTNGRLSYLFLGHNPPSFERKVQPGGTTQFVGYDIDNDQNELWWTRVLGSLGKDFANSDKVKRICLMANEPHWFSTNSPWGNVDFSLATKQKFRAYLKLKYQKIESLNHWWRTDYRSFANIQIQFPLKPQNRGTGMWYDWCRFNMDRVTHFFKRLKRQIRAVDQRVQVTVKIPSQLLSKTSHDHGIDWHALATVQDILGVDSSMDGWRGVGSFQQRRLDWEPSIFLLDFYRSLYPEKLIFDSEWHGFSNIHWRSTNVNHHSLRAKLWLQHLHGLGMTQIWYWGRQSSGKPVSQNHEEFYRSICTSPRAMMTYLDTMIDINDHAEAVGSLVTQKRSVALICSEESAIQDSKYLENLLHVYSAVKRQGVAVKVVPLDQLMVDRKIDVEKVVIPPTRFVLTQHLKLLEKTTQGKNVGLISSGSSHGNVWFEKDAYGATVDQKLLEWTKNAKRISIRAHDAETKLQEFLGTGKFVLRDHDGTPINVLQGASNDGKYLWVANPFQEPATIFLKNKFHDFSGAIDLVTREKLGKTMKLEGASHVRVLKLK